MTGRMQNRASRHPRVEIAASADLKNDRPAETTVGRSTPSGKYRATATALESKLEAKLHDAWVVHCRVHRAKTGRTDVA